MTIKNIIGKKFGKWTVVSYDTKQKWYCKCDCGYFKYHRIDILENGLSTQCRTCSNQEKALANIKDITDKKFGKLIAIKRTGKHSRWICKCECGNECIASLEYLNNGITTSCKNCYYKSMEKPPFHDVLKRIQLHAKRNKKPYNLDEKYLENLWNQQNGKCALTGRDLTLTTYYRAERDNKKRNISLDRIDSSQGYIKGNVQFVDKYANFAKNDLTLKDFINLCKDVINYQKILGNL